MRSVVRGVMGTTCMAVVLCLAGCQDNPNKNQTRNAPTPTPSPAPAPNTGPVLPNLHNTGGGGAVMATLSSVRRNEFANELKNIGLAYKTAAVTGDPPSSAEALGPEFRRYFKDDTIVVVWGADPNSPGASNTVLGYVKDVPEKGGVVLMLDGTVRPNMTSDEFKATPKAVKAK
jgi:hypothetical protein